MIASNSEQPPGRRRREPLRAGPDGGERARNRSRSDRLSSLAHTGPTTDGLWRPPVNLFEEPSWEGLFETLMWWLRPLGQAPFWISLGYLATTTAAAAALFAIMVTVGVLATALLFVFGLGLLLVVPFFRTVDALTRAHVGIAAWFGYEPELRPVESIRSIRTAGIKAAFADGRRWRRVLYLIGNAVISPSLLVIATFPGAVLFNNPTWVDWFTLAWLPIATIMLGLLPRTCLAVAHIRHRLDDLVLGTGRLERAEQRVSALSEQRDDILDAVASERRRIERNLHDGVQQQLVAIGLDLGMAEQQLDENPDVARELLVSAREKVQGSIGDLRQIGRGLHPAILGDRGLDAALSAVVGGAPIPISIHIDDSLDLGRDLSETIYFVVSESIANILKHADATVASVHVLDLRSSVRVTVHDNGRGGADPTTGTGLAGIRARARGLDGTFDLVSPAGGPTSINVEVPTP